MRLVPLTRPLLDFIMAMNRSDLESDLPKFGAVFIPGCSYALMDRGELYGAGGVIPIWPGRAEAWMIVTRLARPRNIVAGVRIAKDWLDEKQRDPAFARIEFFLLSQAAWRVSFASALDLTFLSTLKRWGPDGDDYCHYERLRV